MFVYDMLCVDDFVLDNGGVNNTLESWCPKPKIHFITKRLV
ncbi:hypothetical protein ACSVDA_22525 [Cytobacillus sp. Hm23]|nr:hypothetical protein [Cytobacillus sp. IB215316]MDX8360928.1 hypothetical protein [Cytobacillus sp. IB215316]